MRMLTATAAPLRRWLLIALIAMLSSVAPAWADGQKDVLVLYATRPDSRIAVLGDRELPRILEQGLGQRVNHYSEHLDLARFSDAHYQSAVAEFLRLKYIGQRFDLVIAMHEIVLDFLGSTRQTLFPDSPIVFFSHTPNAPRLPNSTGVVTNIDFASTLAFASALQPSARRAYVVSGADARDKLFEARAGEQLGKLRLNLAITYLSGLPTAELKTRLSTLPPDSIIYYLVVNRDGTGASFHPLEYLHDLLASASAPIYTWVDSAMGGGIVGGSLKSQQKQTEAVAQLALRVLRGEAANSIPTLAPNLQVNQVDWHQLRRWNISESRLPAGTVVLFRDPSIWQRYKLYVIVALALVLAQSALITGLLVTRLRRRQAEEQVRGSQEKLATSYSRIRTLGARLLNAQETERARISRELHDDVSQQLALLAMDLELLRGSAHDDTAGLAAQAWGRTQTIARTVHDLAYRLYPAKLKLIGLVPALQALQREMERSVIVLNFVHKDVPPALPQDVTLCVFRVVQEALQNAAKYSGAQVVSVSIEGTPDGLTVTIADDGIGFDVGATWGKGLGLASMRERTEALNGTLNVDSAPGTGTRLVLVVPLDAGEAVAAAI